MQCPRCDSADLLERERAELVVDVCPACRGVWLDRGELEKLLARARQETEELVRVRSGRAPRAEDAIPERDDDHHDEHRYPRRKRRWFDALDGLLD